MRRTALLTAAVLLLVGSAGPVLGQEESVPGKTMIVLDASGSMWGQVEGQSKIEIAREALDELLGGWNPDGKIGLIAYGHRRKGDCSDIENLVDPDRGGPDAVRAAMKGLDPKGKTPLSAAVRQAAERLRYEEGAANVILLSDGRESCDADPCAVGEELERAGVNFTAHVIGFDVDEPAQAGLRCLAENTGGRFFEAGQAEELQMALSRAAEQVEEPEAGVTLKAVDRPDGPALRADGLRWTLTHAGSDERILDDTALALPRLDLEEGTYVARARLGEASAEKRLDVTADGPSVHELVLEREASLEAPDSVGISAPFEVRWQGPGADGDYLTIVEAGAEEGSFGSWTYTDEGNPLTLQAPDEPGDYEIRYLSGQSNATLARTSLVVTPVETTLEAPERVEAGSTIEVRWQGPGADGDYLTIVEAGAEEGSYNNWTYTNEGNPLTLQAPDEPGEYEIRYLSGQNSRTLARHHIIVE